MSIVTGLNPAGSVNTESEARDAARASAIAIFLGVAWGIVGLVYLTTGGAELMQAAMAEATADQPEVAGMANMLAGAAVGFAGFLVAIQLVLGLVQWFKPNTVIPILFLVLVVYGLGRTLLGLMAAQNVSTQAQMPTWQVFVGLAVLVVQLVLHIAGVRGASALSKFRDASST